MPGVAMARTRLLILVAVGSSITTTITAAALVLLHPRSPRIDQDHFDRIAVGMAKPEVDAILGGPPGDYTDRRFVWSPKYWYLEGTETDLERWFTEEWLDDSGAILVLFDKDHRVRQKWFCPAETCMMIDLSTAQRFQRLSERWFRISWP
jgi:hypothetical protein